MNVKLTVVSVLAMFSVASAHGAPAPAAKEVPFTHLAATATANVVNHLETVENYTKWISARLNESEIAGLKKYFSQMGLKPETKFPKLMADKNKVYFDKNNYMIYNGNNININGKTFTYVDMSFDEAIRDMNEKIGGEKTSRLELIPSAHAMTQNMSLLLSALGGGALGAGLSQNLGLSTKDGILLGAATGVIANYGTQFLGANVAFAGNQQPGSYYCCRNYPGQYCCNQSQGLSFLSVQGGETPVDYRVAYEMNGRYLPPCDSYRLPYAADRFSGWNNRNIRYAENNRIRYQRGLPPEGAKLVHPGNSISF